MSASTAIFWPVIVQIILVNTLYQRLWVKRLASVRSGAAKVGDFRENLSEPQQSLLIRNSLANQFELPTLFYVLCISIYVTGHATVLPVLFAWVFVASRISHALVHTGSNRIRYRMPLFSMGLFTNGLLLVWFVVNIATN